MVTSEISICSHVSLVLSLPGGRGVDMGKRRGLILLFFSGFKFDFSHNGVALEMYFGGGGFIYGLILFRFG